LSELYSIADAAFVGGSLVPIGGHNVLEPAVHGVPVLFGPHTGHVAEPAAALESVGGGMRVASPRELAATVGDLLGDPGRRAEAGRRALELVESGRGALARSSEILLAARRRDGEGAT
jgi:3-deoxy-D-manno-octulosonic-acid transferase